MEHASANHIAHPTTIYVRVDLIVPRLDGLLAKLFAPQCQAETVAAMAAASVLDRRLANRRTLLDGPNTERTGPKCPARR